MQTFSQENLEKLSDEYKLINMAIARLQRDVYFNRTYGVQASSSAITNLTIRKIELEAMIEALTDHLN